MGSSNAAAPEPFTFRCTFCHDDFWSAKVPPDSSSLSCPRVVGSPSSARLACGPCYAALLDLATCWSCGEVVLRGEACVSLGWCFWHGACYGCLLCGGREGLVTGREAVGPRGDGDGDRDGGKRKKGRARETDEVPLCRGCWEEVREEERRNQNEKGGDVVVEKALRGMDARGVVDGGLSRRRWEMQQQKDGFGIRRQEDGANLDPDARVRTASVEATTIYVNMRDPFGQPSFKPSRTKPIPQWMRPLGLERAPTPRLPGPGDEPMTGEGAVCARVAGVFATTAQDTVVLEETELPNDTRRRRATSFVTAEPLRRPSSSRALRMPKATHTSLTTMGISAPGSAAASPRRFAECSTTATTPSSGDKDNRSPSPRQRRAFPFTTTTTMASSVSTVGQKKHVPPATVPAQESCEFLDLYANSGAQSLGSGGIRGSDVSLMSLSRMPTTVLYAARAGGKLHQYGNIGGNGSGADGGRDEVGPRLVRSQSRMVTMPRGRVVDEEDEAVEEAVDGAGVRDGRPGRGLSARGVVSMQQGREAASGAHPRAVTASSTTKSKRLGGIQSDFKKLLGW